MECKVFSMKCPIDNTEWKTVIGLQACLYNHDKDKIVIALVKMIAADMIPRAKVEAKIKELENHYTVGLNRFDKNWSDYDMATNANRAVLSHLSDLLNNTEKVEEE